VHIKNDIQIFIVTDRQRIGKIDRKKEKLRDRWTYRKEQTESKKDTERDRKTGI
jgi:hypothetical protein